MRPDEHLHRLASETKWCPKRGTCPLAFLCGAPLADGRALLPAIDEFDREDLIWTDLSTRPRVHVVRSGLLLSKVYTSDDQEFPYALFSEGFVSGLTELYTPFVASSFYYLQGIIPGQICRFDSDDVREIVDGLPASQSLALANITLMNSSTANYVQILTLAHGTARDKVASVLVRIVNQLSAHGEPPTDLPLTHSDVALIAHLDLATASRELKGLAKAGAVELGYRLIRCRDPLLHLPPSVGRAPPPLRHGPLGILPVLRSMCRPAQLTPPSLSSGTHFAPCIPWDTGRARALRAAGGEPRSLPSEGRT